MDTILRWAIAAIINGKRLSILVVALLNLLTPILANYGIEVPDPVKQQIVSSLVVAILAGWSKIDAMLKAKAGAPKLT